MRVSPLWPSAAPRILLAVSLMLGVLGTQPARGAPDPDSEPRWISGDDTTPTVAFPSVPQPVESWVYDELDRQFSQGNLTELAIHSRPLPRALIAAAVARALAGGQESVGLRRLAREFAWETRMMDLDTGFPDTRPLLTLGPPASMVKVNAEGQFGGDFEEGESAVIGPLSYLGFHGEYWGGHSVGIFGDYRVTEVPGSEQLGDPVISGTDIIYLAPRFGLTWHNTWFALWGGRDNLRWGPGRSGGLLAGGGSPPFTQVGFRVHVGTLLTATAVHAWLSQAEGRYAAFHRLELRASSSLRFGISEGVRYDGSSVEPIYLLNLVTYAAAERMLTQEGSADADRDSLFRSNFNLGADAAWSPGGGTTLYGEFMLDDWKTDGSGPTRLAYQLGARWVRESSRRLSLQTEFTRVYNYTYTVYYGRDFIHSDGYLGHARGPDTQDLRAWADLDVNLEWSLGLEAFWTRTGEGNRSGPWCPDELVSDNPYDTECQSFGAEAPGGSTLSGVVENRVGALLGATFAPRDQLRIEAEAGLAQIENNLHVSGTSETRPLARLRLTVRW